MRVKGRFGFELTENDYNKYRKICDMYYERLVKAIEYSRRIYMNDDTVMSNSPIYIYDNEDENESIYNTVFLDKITLSEVVFGEYKDQLILLNTMGFEPERYTLFDIFQFDGPVARAQKLYSTIGYKLFMTHIHKVDNKYVFRYVLENLYT